MSRTCKKFIEDLQVIVIIDMLVDDRRLCHDKYLSLHAFSFPIYIEYRFADLLTNCKYYEKAIRKNKTTLWHKYCYNNM